MTGRDHISMVSRAAKLKEIALSPTNTGSERVRAIELLGRLDGEAYDALADIAARGPSRNERIAALEMLGKVSRRETQPRLESVYKENLVAEVKSRTKAPVKRRMRKPLKLPRIIEAKRQITSGDGLSEATFNEMLHQVKPLLVPPEGFSESQIKKQFTNLKGTVVEMWLTMAIRRGLIREVNPGMFKLIERRKSNFQFSAL